MPNLSTEKQPMPMQPAVVRRGNFEEVELGYTAEQAAEEAARCLNCKAKPCVAGCPVGVEIPRFIEKLSEGDLKGAYDVIAESSSLPAVCGRVCPQESQCEMQCVRGKKGEPVAIGRLERYVADWHNAQTETTAAKPAASGKKVAVIGAGPAGLACAGDLARAGHAVTIYESLHLAGGVLSYGIPEFRLPKRIVAKEVSELEQLGVEIHTNSVIGKLRSVEELLDTFDAVFISTGAGLPNFMGIPGEMLLGVYSANEFLTRINLMKAYLPDAATPLNPVHKVAVVGGGNVAMDAARCALRMGAEEVSIVYRRSMEEMPARKEEVHHAEEEGIRFATLINPTEILGDEEGRVRGLRCIRMTLGEPDASGRRRPIEQPGSKFDLEVDTVIMAIGTSPNPLIKNTTPSLEVNRRGCFVVDEQMHTSKDAVWAGGDAVTGAATVISAMGAGKTAAAAINEYLANNN
ncbi:NADPH-dependent glutamate synthase [Pygmaiobacter massiliensis]|uniref:NADPH-dependent glutamate synthase n=1 Tax=Pygmaiobacter massiliensis TaxID=1917873 RepID=UPI002A836D99|nr:NADPH-dependent glutamate synthase [Pygmaiobacter massiliensis]MDY4785807.1 NADPH-dependent glutamate synthase [Pygmaiobacter massiliensis]